MSNNSIKYNYKFFVLCAILLSITILFSLISSFIPSFYGFPIELQYVGYLFSILILNKSKLKYFFFIITPWLILLITRSYIINFLQLLTEYIFTYYCFFIFLMWKKSKKDTYNIFSFILFLTISYCIKFFLHVISGYIWWTDNDILYSLILNSSVIFGNLLINLPLIILSYPLIINKKYRKKIKIIFL